MKGLHTSEREVYQRDVATLKQYRPDYYKITLHKQIRRAGYEAIEEDTSGKRGAGKKNTDRHEEKLEQSLSRTRSTIYELAICNDWAWFVTLTLNPEYHDRKDLNRYKKKLTVWIKNYNRIHEINVKYLLIPEQHADGQSWHMHGLLAGLPKEQLEEFTIQEKLPIKMVIEIARGNKLYNWPAYAKKFGYVSLSRVRNIERTARYITKYITKDITKTKIGKNSHFYYCSKGLKRAETIYQGPLTKELEEEYSNDYMKIKTVRSMEEAIQYFVDE